jgi:phage terminase large subunit
MTAELKINAHFFPLLSDESRYEIIFGGAGSGKSHFTAQKIILRCLDAKQGKHRILVCRKVHRTIKESVFQNILSIIIELGLVGKVRANYSDLSFTFPTGSKIIMVGLDDVVKLKSIAGITSIWIEEATELEKYDFDQLDLRLRGETSSYKQIILTLNPIDENHWIKQTLIDTTDKAFVHHSTFIDNVFIDEEYKKMLEERVALDENLYRIYVKGEWGVTRTGAEFFPQFKVNRHVTNEIKYDPTLALHITFDFNVVPYQTLLVFQIIKDGAQYTIRGITEICSRNPKNTIEDVCEIFSAEFPEHRAGVYIYGDPSGRARNMTDKQNRTNVEKIESLLRKYLHNSSNRFLYSHPLIIERKNFVNRCLAEREPIQIMFHSDMQNTIADFTYLQEDADGTKLKKRVYDKMTGEVYEKYGHTSDAFEYFITSAFQAFFKRN